MAVHALTENFKSFFGNLNPSATTEVTAAREYAAVKTLIEDPNSAAKALSPKCFLQGSYKQQTAIYTLHDIDIVVLCQLWQPGSEGPGPSWTRDQIFETIATPITGSSRFRGKVKYGPTSMCIKIDSEMWLEVLPVVYKSGTYDSQVEPFRLYRPEKSQWEDGFAREHQRRLTWKNEASKTGSNFIPMVKVLKHIRSEFGSDAVSFHLECLLFKLPDSVFRGGPADYVATALSAIVSLSADEWYRQIVRTPCEDRDIFTSTEWGRESWNKFHDLMTKCAGVADVARTTENRSKAIEHWQALLGTDRFPHL